MEKKYKIILIFIVYTSLAYQFIFNGWFNNVYEYFYLDRQELKIEFIEGEDLDTRIFKLQTKCGDLCDTNKQIMEKEFIGTVKSEVNCPKLFMTLKEFSDSAPRIKPPSWENHPREIKNHYSYNKRVKISEWYFDEAYPVSDNDEPIVFTKETLEEKHINPLLDTGIPVGNPGYPNSGNLVLEAVDYLDVRDKKILVIGTQTPWLEGILLAKDPEKIVTVEYGSFLSTHPLWTFIKPDVFREKFQNGTLDTFDVIFSYSSLEHSGLGRYGDPVNPWGDIMAVAETWCVSSPNAKLAIAVPTSVSLGADFIPYNAHRIYGPVLYPFLTTNWKFKWPTDVAKRTSPENAQNGIYQPVFIFEKN